jgi:hypothetical protein
LTPLTAQTIPVRSTQSFVHTLSECWRRPSLTALEIAWRWTLGIPTIALLVHEAARVLRQTPLDWAALERMSLTDPLTAAATLARAVEALTPATLHIAAWLAPLLAVAWVIVSSLGRTLVLRRADPGLHARAVTLTALQVPRILALASVFAVWLCCLRAADRFAVDGPIASGQEPNLVLFCTIAIVSTLGLFSLWAVGSWIFFVAPLLAMRRNLSAAASLANAFRLGPVRNQLMELNLVMGIVKIALIVLAMVLSACPLPFESVATPEFMRWWYAGTAVLYIIASDFFHISRLVGYLSFVEIPK